MNEDRSPATREFYIELGRFLRLHQITQDQFRIELNKFLPRGRKVKPNHVGAVMISKWLSTTAKKWNEPRTEITLAAKKALDSLQNETY